MNLQSQLFRGDSKLEAAAISDTAHILPGSIGPHIGKIQRALILLDGAAIFEDSVYGPATAAAVLAYKQKRNIINRSYQTKADNIVGKMTIASLDQEMLASEVIPSGPSRLTPIVIPNRPSPFEAEAPSLVPRLHLGFALDGKTLSPNVLPSLSGGDVEVRPNEVTSCTVLNAAGREMFLKNAGTPTSSSSPIFARAKVFDPTKSESSQNGRVKITELRQVVNVRGLSPGKNDIVFTQTSGRFVDIVGSVTVLFDAKVFFHFVDGVPGVKTNRTPGVEAAFIAVMNRIYRRQVGIVFGSAGVNPSLNMSNIRPKKGAFNNVGIPVILGGKTPEEEAIVNHRKTDVLFNVFFVGDIVDLSNALSGDPGDDFLAVTSFSAHAGLGLGRFLRNLVGPPGRCCLLRDQQKRDDGKVINFGQVLAHECGHALDEDDITDQSKSDHLMFFSASNSTGTKIPFLSAFEMMNSALQFPP